MIIKTKKLTELFVYDDIGIALPCYNFDYMLEHLTIDKNKNIIKQKTNNYYTFFNLVEWSSEKEFSDIVIKCLVENELNETIQTEFENVICDKSFDITKLKLVDPFCTNYCFLDFPEQYKNKAIITPSSEMFGCIASQADPYYLKSSFFIVGPYTVETI